MDKGYEDVGRSPMLRMSQPLDITWTQPVTTTLSALTLSVAIASLVVATLGFRWNKMVKKTDWVREDEKNREAETKGDDAKKVRDELD